MERVGERGGKGGREREKGGRERRERREGEREGREGEEGKEGGRERREGGRGGRERGGRERKERETLTQVHTRQNLRPLRGKESKRRIGSMTRNSALGVPSHS